MELSGRLFLAVIEEDNTQRVLFRVRPLLGEKGPVQQEDLDEFGDDGFLRIVPDRHEQHTFKERMRSLDTLCLINLRDTTPGLDKVRPNKNYAPQRGEHNRFVIYSDAVRNLEDVVLYEVISEGRAAVAGTPAYYLRKRGHIQGPFDRGSGEPVDALSCIAPDDNRLYAVSMPDGRERLFYWPQTALIEIPQAAIAAEQDVQQEEPAEAEPAPEAAEEAVADEAQPEAEAEASLEEAVAAPAPEAPFEGAVDALQGIFVQAGYEMDRDDAANLLLHLLLFPGLRLTARYLPDARLAVRLIGQALGVGQAEAARLGYAKLFAAQDVQAQAKPAEEQAMLWPCILMEVRPGFGGRLPASPGAARDAAQLHAALQGEGQEIPVQATALLEEAERLLAEAGCPLPLTLKLDLLRYLRSAPALLSGGADAALDFALCCWLIPFARQQGADTALLRPLCEAMPRALARL